MFWDASSDQMRVRVNISEKSHTLRGLLSMISQTHDPLGVSQPFLLPARLLLQQACLHKLGWDEEFENCPGLELGWEGWFKALPELEQACFSRCPVPAEKQPARIELHPFADGSTVGYGACSYIRCVNCNGDSQCSLLMGKSLVAPLRGATVPRLELVAAVLAAKSSALICRELDIVSDSVNFWADATMVLRYIRNTSTRFETFVANRVDTLHMLTSVEQWRYVPSKLNPTDIASRGLSPAKVADANLWFYGPTFLRDFDVE